MAANKSRIITCAPRSVRRICRSGWLAVVFAKPKDFSSSFTVAPSPSPAAMAVAPRATWLYTSPPPINSVTMAHSVRE